MTDGSHLDAGALFRAHREFVTKILVQFGAPSVDVPDLLQEVFLVAHRKGGFVPKTARATSWLGAIAMNVALRRKRSLAREREREALDPHAGDDAVSPGGSPSAATQAHEELKAVRRALRCMSGPKRAVFVMYELEGRSCEEIARLLRVPVGTVYSRLHTARREFIEQHSAPENQIPLALSESISQLSLGVEVPGDTAN